MENFGVRTRRVGESESLFGETLTTTEQNGGRYYRRDKARTTDEGENLDGQILRGRDESETGDVILNDN